MEISNLVEDLVEEILCKLPVTSLRAVRLTCKKWNNISKTQRFAEKHINKVTREVSMIMVIDYKVCLMRTHNNINGIPSLTRKSELIGLDKLEAERVGFEKIDIIRVYHCDGLLLCSTEQAWTRGLVVWNPYWGQIRWIKPQQHSYGSYESFAMGYEVINHNTRRHKILKFFENYADKYEIHDFKYNSWRDIVITGQELQTSGVSLKGNTYWFGKENNGNYFLICFDFTRERFGPRMSFPFTEEADNVVLSSVKGEKLAVLVERFDTFEMEIWITSGEINPTMVSWSKLLTVKKIPISACPFSGSLLGGSFFIDEENKVVVFVGRDLFEPRNNKAYIYGEDGYLIKKVDLGGSTDLGESTDDVGSPRVCSYVPSSVLIG